MTNSVQPGSKARQHTALEATAYHEAGHAVVAWRLGHRPDMVTIVATGESAGQVKHAIPFPGFSLDFDGSDRARLRIERAIMVCLAGPIAQRRYRRTSWRKWHGAADYATASELAFRVCGSREIAGAFLNWLELKANALVEEHWDAIERVAQALLQRGVLVHDEMRHVITGGSHAPVISHTLVPGAETQGRSPAAR